ncbi:MAG: type II secretion system F family protein [Patescibacteria group bacterium]|nr:type II secretion system F family protein [Patescibacteria group bacterium]
MKFKYKATTIEGREQKGRIEAGSIERAVELLQKHKLIIVSIKPIREFASFTKIFSFLNRVSKKKVVMFSKELSVLLTANIPLVEALKIQYEQEDNPYFREQIFMISKMVDDGAPFSVALSRFPNIFSDFYVNIVKSGEASGKLQESLYHLSAYIEKQHILTSKVKNALMYPAVIMGGFGLVGLGMMAFVVPQLISVFEGSGQELPLPTKILVASSNFIQGNFILILISLIVFGYIIKKYVSTIEGKEKVDKFILMLPQFKTIFQKFYLARFAENLSMLIGSGIPIVNALKISGDVVGNEVYKKVVYNSVDEVKMGGSIAYAFERSNNVPPLIAKMIRVGEKTGRVDIVLKDVGKFYTKEVDIAVDGLMSLIEPIMIFVLGGGVGLLVAAILMPIYQMTETM